MNIFTEIVTLTEQLEGRSSVKVANTKYLSSSDQFMIRILGVEHTEKSRSGQIYMVEGVD